MGTVNVAMDFSQVNAMAHRLGVDAKPAIEHEMLTTMQRVVLKGQRLAVSTAKHDTGDNRRRHTSTVERVEDGVIGTIGTNAPHGPTVEYGRKPGSKMPPKGVLLDWMRRHPQPNLGKRKMTIEQREFALRRAIARRGIPGDHNLENTVKKIAPDAEREFAQIGPRVIQRLVKGLR